MAETRLSGADRLRQRCWSFADCSFDESNWMLVVRGERIAIEAKPLEILRELLLRATNVVTKDALLDSVWPNVTVVEASLPTAVRKLRLALGDHRRDQPIIETVQGIGYRMAVPVKVEELSAIAPAPIVAESAVAGGAGEISRGQRTASRFPRAPFVSSAVGIGFVAMAFAFASSQQVPARKIAPALTQRDAGNALRKLDVGTIETLLAAGWNPNTPFDDEGNGAINYVLNKCEWDRGHDQEQMVLMVRTLIDGGARLDHPNVWGDTPYSIAKAVRYCGPNHPVTRSIRTMCYAGFKPLGDRCLASYEIERRDHGHKTGA